MRHAGTVPPASSSAGVGCCGSAGPLHRSGAASRSAVGLESRFPQTAEEVAGLGTALGGSVCM